MASTIIPTMRYADAQKMIDWLCDTSVLSGTSSLKTAKAASHMLN